MLMDWGRFGLFAAAGALSVGLAGCDSVSLFSSAPPAPAVSPYAGAGVSADQFVGGWGLASYHRDADRARTEKEAKAQCNRPYVIAKGPNGGLMMHLPDQSAPDELALKGAEGHNYIGPPNDKPGGANDREVVQVSADSFTIHWVDPDTAQRYGTMVYERCRGKAG